MSESFAEEFKRDLILAADLLDGNSRVSETTPDRVKKIVSRTVYLARLEELITARGPVDSFLEEDETGHVS